MKNDECKNRCFECPDCLRYLRWCKRFDKWLNKDEIWEQEERKI